MMYITVISYIYISSHKSVFIYLTSYISHLFLIGDASLVDCMTAASLPSTLVKCLYLFFDLPTVLESLEQCSEFSAQERRVLLQKVFVQVKLGYFIFIILRFRDGYNTIVSLMV